MRLILLGAPGCGKGTQAVYLNERLGIPSISTGNILREACRNKTALGDKVQAYMKAGKLVPDDMIIQVVEERISQSDCKKGYILDGFPRTVVQASSLTTMLNNKKEDLDFVVNLDVDDAELISRLTGRRQCRQCSAGFHVVFAPPKVLDKCDRCGGELYQREDDQEATIKERLKVYQDQTAPLIEYYKEKGILKNIPGTGDVKDVSKRIIEELKI